MIYAVSSKRLIEGVNVRTSSDIERRRKDTNFSCSESLKIEKNDFHFLLWIYCMWKGQTTQTHQTHQHNVTRRSQKG